MKHINIGQNLKNMLQHNQNKIHWPSWDELCEAFLVTLSGRAYHWFQTIRHNITNTNKLCFNSDQHTVQEFAPELNLLPALIGATNAQIIDKFKECFPPEIESQLLDINNLDHLVTKANQLVQLFKLKQTISSSLLSHSAQEQLSQNVLHTNEFQKEYKGPTGSKWTNDNLQKSKGQYQNSCNPRNPGQFNNQTQTCN